MERRRRSQQDERTWQQASYEDERWYDAEPVEEEPYREQVEEIMATNRTVQLTCTLAAMMPLFALFLIFAEKKSRAMRHFSLQSVGLTVFHIVIGAVLLVVNAIFGGIPFLGFLLSLVIWIVYIIAVIVMLILRIRMMFLAWQGVKFTLPLVGTVLERLV